MRNVTWLVTAGFVMALAACDGPPPADPNTEVAMDVDEDGDGIPMSSDLCPGQKEDGTGAGAAATDGCPSGATPTAKDSDNDGIVDKFDKCQGKAEDKQPPTPNDGCPKGG